MSSESEVHWVPVTSISQLKVGLRARLAKGDWCRMEGCLSLRSDGLWSLSRPEGLAWLLTETSPNGSGLRFRDDHKDLMVEDPCPVSEAPSCGETIVNAITEDMKMKEGEIKAACEALQRAHAVNGALLKRISDMERALVAKTESEEKLNSQVKELDETLRQVRDSHRSIYEQNKELQEKLLNTESLASDFCKAEGAATDQLSRERTAAEGLSKEIATLRTRVHNLEAAKKDYSTLLESYEKLESQLTEVEAKAERLLQENKVLLSRAAKAVAEAERLREVEKRMADIAIFAPNFTPVQVSQQAPLFIDVKPHLAANGRWHVTYRGMTRRLENLSVGFNWCLGFVYGAPPHAQEITSSLRQEYIYKDGILIGYSIKVPYAVRFMPENADLNGVVK